MFLTKRSVRPVGKGSFCRLSDDIRADMRNTDSYQKTGNHNSYTYHDGIHLADSDILYVVDDNVFDKKGLARVIAINFESEGYWMDRATKCANKSVSFTIDSSKLQTFTRGVKAIAKDMDLNFSRLSSLASVLNDNFNLHSKSIPISWADN